MWGIFSLRLGSHLQVQPSVGAFLRVMCRAALSFQWAASQVGDPEKDPHTLFFPKNALHWITWYYTTWQFGMLENVSQMHGGAITNDNAFLCVSGKRFCKRFQHAKVWNVPTVRFLLYSCPGGSSTFWIPSHCSIYWHWWSGKLERVNLLKGTQTAIKAWHLI